MTTKTENQYKRIKTKRQYIDYYKNKTQAEDYAKRDFVGANPLITQVETEIVLSLAKNYFVPEKSNYLDLATGSGRIIKSLEKHFGEAVGVDTSEAMLSVAKKGATRSKFRIADIESLPFDQDTFDLITGFRFLINLPKKTRIALLKEATRVLKNGGILAVNIHLNKLSPRGIRDIFLKRRPPEKLLSYFEIKNELEEAGLKAVYVWGVNMLILHKFFPFVPHKLLVEFDKFFGRIQPINYFSDTFVVFAQKVLE